MKWRYFELDWARCGRLYGSCPSKRLRERGMGGPDHVTELGRIKLIECFELDGASERYQKWAGACAIGNLDRCAFVAQSNGFGAVAGGENCNHIVFESL